VKNCGRLAVIEMPFVRGPGFTGRMDRGVPGRRLVGLAPDIAIELPADIKSAGAHTGWLTNAPAENPNSNGEEGGRTWER
jgi:hypothetical protein